MSMEGKFVLTNKAIVSLVLMLVCRHAEGETYQLARFSTFRLSSLRLFEKGFKRQTLFQDEEENATMMKWLKEPSTEFYEAEIHCLIRSWNIAIERNGDYIEK